jgi:hypothetical protein
MPRVSLLVRVYDYTHVPENSLTRSEAEAARILGEVGIRAAWITCSHISLASSREESQLAAMGLLLSSPDGKAQIRRSLLELLGAAAEN